MKIKQIRFFLLALACCSLLASAQDSSMINVQGGGKKGKIPLWIGAHKIGNSIVSQSGTTVTTNGNAVASATSGVGSYGQVSTSGESNTGVGLSGLAVGAWGDGGLDGNYGVFGTADDRAGVIGENNGGSYYTLFSFNNASGSIGFPFGAFNGDGAGCNIDPLGDLSCSGSKNAVVAVNAGKSHVALAAIESPKNWFEDFGSARLSGGVAVVRLDSKFTQTVNSKMEYHVFLTPNGDCKGLYVNQKSPTSFEVRELGGGNSSVKFDYRITALRKNYESIRFANHPEFPLGRKDGRVLASK